MFSNSIGNFYTIDIILGNLSDGSGLLVQSFGNQIKQGDKIRILLELTDGDMKMYLFHNERPLGLAFHVHSPYPKPLYPVVSFGCNGKVTITRSDQIHGSLERLSSQCNNVEGKWKVIDFPQHPECIDCQFKIQRHEHGENMYVLFTNVVNMLHCSLEHNPTTNEWKSADVISTLMTGPLELIEEEHVIRTLLAVTSCEQKRCCVSEMPPTIGQSCLTQNSLTPLFNTSRGRFIQKVLSRGIYEAGICSNCQAKAAFLAIATTMTDNFENDEATGSDAQFAGDDNKYGNVEPGDGSRFRQRGLFGLRGRRMYQRLQTLLPQYRTLTNPELAAITENAIIIAAQLWKNPNLLDEVPLTSYADGTFYRFSILWFKLTGGIEKLALATKQYSKFLRQLQCGGDLYPGQGLNCTYNATHQGICSADCIKGLEDSGEYCGCVGGAGPQCPNSPIHVRCCLDTCSQELKMDLGFVLDASDSVGANNYELQRIFVKDLLRRVNVGRNKTHVGIINYSTGNEILTWLDQDYTLQQKIQAVDRSVYFGEGTNTNLALRQANTVFSSNRGLREPEDGATQVIFVVTDGESANRNATVEAAKILKDKGIHLVSVGVGDDSNLDLIELHAICTPPAVENYFEISDYSALDRKLNQFTSKTCSKPAPLPTNITVTGEVGKDKYKFLKIKIEIIGNKIKITITLLNGNVKVFYSFNNRNPKDPDDFNHYETKTSNLFGRFFSQFESYLKGTRASNNEMTLIINKPDTNPEFVYVGVKGVEDNNKFELFKNYHNQTQNKIER
ncbi:unnamed protein product [Rotaria sordida]|uniref:VWFA domain-containing protein n=1 Tax=Rotaria sordida TaxID=392033 RepID=A0A818WCT4_9BILA|nr:unnamed protein product [Rotaria sordida]